MDTHVAPGVQRLLDRFTDVPVMVLSASWHLVVVNRLGAALLGDLSAAPVRERNMIWRHFTGLPDRFVMTAEERRGAGGGGGGRPTRGVRVRPLPARSRPACLAARPEAYQ
ncbi:hypothetical protein [Micromonospora sp. MP36]|uniref:MmyB family transcriptional regulator n=1 Tax=unclassified Micromonospora TaxID=2617518 RepID=UPI001652A7DD